jgi:hypothetical protein
MTLRLIPEGERFELRAPNLRNFGLWPEYKRRAALGVRDRESRK